MKTIFSSSAAWTGAFAILCAAPVFVSAQECIQLTAQITQTNHVKLGNTTNRWTFPVTCSVWNNQWKMDNRYSRNGLESAFYDGTNVYSSLEVISENDAKTNTNLRRVTITIAPSAGGNPLGNLGVNIPWLAFCSGNYLKMPHRIIPLPVLDVPGSADSLSCVDKTTTFDDEGGLPKTVELVTSKAAFLSSLSDERLYRNPRLRQAQQTRAFIIADGLVEFRYEIETSTNFNGRIFPTRFRYFDYRFLSVKETNHLTLVAEGVGTVIAIKQAPIPGNVFSTNGVQTVLDCRFRQRDKLLDAIYYSWPKAEVPSTNEPALQQRLQEMVRGAASIEDVAP